MVRMHIVNVLMYISQYLWRVSGELAVVRFGSDSNLAQLSSSETHMLTTRYQIYELMIFDVTSTWAEGRPRSKCSGVSFSTQ